MGACWVDWGAAGVNVAWRRLGTAVTGHLPITVTLQGCQQKPSLLFQLGRCLISPVFLNTLGGIQRTSWALEKQNILSAPLVTFLFSSFFKNFVYFIYFIFGCIGSSLLHVGFSLVAASRGYSSLQCTGFSFWWLLLFRSTGSRHVGFSSCGTRAQ